MKTLHTCDWHLRDADIFEAEKCLNFLIETAKTDAVDLVVVAGDTFDSQDVKLDSKAAKLAVKTFSALADICPVAVIIGTPSHDGMAAEILRYIRGTYDVYVATSPVQVLLENGHFGPCERNEKWGQDPDAVLTLIPAPTKQFFQTNSDIKTADQEIAQAMSALFAGFGATASQLQAPHVLVGHWNVTGSLISETQTLTGIDIEISPDQMNLAGACVNMLGHIHKSQQIKDNVFYAGSLFPQNWGELDDKGFYIMDIEGRELKDFRFVKTPCRKLIRIQDDLTEKTKEDSAAFTADVSGASIRYDITVFQDEAGEIDKDVIRREFLYRGALDVDIRINRIPRENIRADAVLKAETLRDKIVAMAALREERISDSIQIKADRLENMEPDELVAMVGGAA
jgi:exonuclease SbcD